MITNDFQFKLESAIQWEIWEIELLVHLEMIVGANGVALLYVIYQNSVPDHIYQLMWYEKVRLAAPHTCNKYKLDALAVHNIVTGPFRKPLMHTCTSNLRSRKKMAKLISNHSKIGNITQQCKTCLSMRPRKLWIPFPTGIKGP